MASQSITGAFRQQAACFSGRAALQPLQHRPAVCGPRRRGRAARCAAAAEEAEERGWRQGVKRFDFAYMSPADAAAAEAEAQAAWQASMDEYAALQEWLLFRTWRFGVLFAGYLLLAASGEAAFCELVGTAVGYGYLKWLIADVGRLQPGDNIPLRAAEAVEPRALRWAAKLAAAYGQALQPRLLVLPGMAAAAAAWNAALPDAQLGPVEQGCLLGGFLSWKVALALRIYEELKPQPLTEEQILRQKRPALVEVEDVPLDLRGAARRAAEAAAAAQQQQQQQQQQEAAAEQGKSAP